MASNNNKNTQQLTPSQIQMCVSIYTYILHLFVYLTQEALTHSICFFFFVFLFCITIIFTKLFCKTSAINLVLVYYIRKYHITHVFKFCILVLWDLNYASTIKIRNFLPILTQILIEPSSTSYITWIWLLLQCYWLMFYSKVTAEQHFTFI